LVAEAVKHHRFLLTQASDDNHRQGQEEAAADNPVLGKQEDSYLVFPKNRSPSFLYFRCLQVPQSTFSRFTLFSRDCPYRHLVILRSN
jgi:hypothetical protein